MKNRGVSLSKIVEENSPVPELALAGEAFQAVSLRKVSGAGGSRQECRRKAGGESVGRRRCAPGTPPVSPCHCLPRGLAWRLRSNRARRHGALLRRQSPPARMRAAYLPPVPGSRPAAVMAPWRRFGLAESQSGTPARNMPSSRPADPAIGNIWHTDKEVGEAAQRMVLLTINAVQLNAH